MNEVLTKADVLGKIVMYHGGSYDGCIEEPNSFYVTPDGGLRNIYSSGRDGVLGWARFDDMSAGCGKIVKIGEDEIAEAWETFLDPDWQDRCRPETYDENEIDALIEYWRGDLVHSTMTAVSQDRAMPESFRDKLLMPCWICGDKFHVTEIWPDEGTRHGCGGIATVVDDMVCEDCEDRIKCSLCDRWEYPCDLYRDCFSEGDYAGGLSEVCEGCFKTEAELEAPDRIRAAIAAIRNSDDDRAKYGAVMGRYCGFDVEKEKEKLAEEVVAWFKQQRECA